MIYEFFTMATMKEHNKDKWWINSDIVPTFRTEAENLKEAIEEYRDFTARHCYVDISATAMRNKSPMYHDTENGPEQIGYVITASTEFERENYGGWSKQYIDLWVKINIATNPFIAA